MRHTALLELGILAIAIIILLIILGIIILIVVVRGIFHWLPAVVAAVIVYVVWRDLLLAAIAFLVVAVLMIAFRARR